MLITLFIYLGVISFSAGKYFIYILSLKAKILKFLKNNKVLKTYLLSVDLLKMQHYENYCCLVDVVYYVIIHCIKIGTKRLL